MQRFVKIAHACNEVREKKKQPSVQSANIL